MTDYNQMLKRAQKRMVMRQSTLRINIAGAMSTSGGYMSATMLKGKVLRKTTRLSTKPTFNEVLDVATSMGFIVLECGGSKVFIVENNNDAVNRAIAEVGSGTHA